MRPYNRIYLVPMGAAVYWVGYTGFLTMQHVACPCLCMFLIVSGLWVASKNSSNLSGANNLPADFTIRQY